MAARPPKIMVAERENPIKYTPASLTPQDGQCLAGTFGCSSIPSMRTMLTTTAYCGMDHGATNKKVRPLYGIIILVCAAFAPSRATRAGTGWLRLLAITLDKMESMPQGSL